MTQTNDIAIRVEGLSKQYRLGGRREKYKTLRDTLAGVASAPARAARRLAGRAGGSPEVFQALKGVSFEVRRGEVVGVIGRNGAGKSTLLKILSRITDPTAGYADISGRVGSLLEVGTGFHPELTGRENVYLNGAILGMKKHEIDRKFDEIVDFSEVEKFIDTPVKHYSSGMHLRLAFAVAAHLEPEIVIIDEVLAVGDAAFQQKCIGKMGDVAQRGRTVLFVSHNMAAVEKLCTRGIVLDGGRIVSDGDQNEAIQQYLNLAGEAGLVGRYEADPAPVLNGSRSAMITRVRVTSGGRDCGGRFPIGAPLEFHVEGVSRGELFHPQVGIGIENNRATRVFTLHTKCAPPDVIPSRVANRFSFVCRVPRVALAPGTYSVQLGLAEGENILEWFAGAFRFTVRQSDIFGNAGKFVGGVVYVDQEWEAVTC
ncbi:MAG TPA: ABC transporter ATP-binding protein [Pyrinomonadaceae bacterium]|nr:ABC transporter ATP-binding protein [Pyrinomonadaceae bacterium]